MAKRKNVVKANVIPKGYKIQTVERYLNPPAGDGGLYELVELSGSKMEKPKQFVDVESAMAFIEKNEAVIIMNKALNGKTRQPPGYGSIKKMAEELKSMAELELLADSEKKSDRAAAKIMYSDSD